jgi:ankyrin repeat protein
VSAGRTASTSRLTQYIPTFDELFSARASGHRAPAAAATARPGNELIVPHSPPLRKLRQHPDLNQLRRQARELLDAFRAGDPDAVAEVNAHYRGADAQAFALHDAQLVLARSYGFDSWPKLKAYVDGVTVQRLADAVRAGDLEKVRALLQRRPELVNTVMAWNNEHTALHYAVLRRMPGMVRVLMELGADARAGISPHTDATSALTLARDRGYDEIVAIITEAEKRREAGWPSVDEVHEELRRAMQSRDEARAIAILERRPDLVLAQDRRNGWTFLHVASAMLLRRAALWLLDHAADVNARAKDGSTPLDVVGRGCTAAKRATALATVAKLLRDRGAALTARSAVILGDEAFLRARHGEGALTIPLDDRGWLLGRAAEYDRPDILKLLLDFGLDPWGRVELAKLLLERGADPVEADAEPWATPGAWAEKIGHHAVLAVLREHAG